MVGTVALAAAPMANAQNAGLFCGHNYAFIVNGTEPVTATSAAQTLPLNYIAGVGVLQFAASGTAGAGNCTVGGEMIYVDNDYLTFQGGPTNCPTISSIFGELPCFDGMDSHIAGGTGPGPNGSNTLQFAATFPTVVGVSNTANVTLPFTFTIFTTKLAATMIGNSNIPTGGTGPGQTSGNPNPCPPSAPVPPGENASGCGPNSPTPPLGPVLGFTAQQQSTTPALNPVPTVYGKAPYVGSAAILCTGYGGPMADLVASGQATQADEATGAFGATSGSLNVFANGQASGSLSFNTNDDVGNTTGLSNWDCDFQQVNEDAFGDGTNDNEALVQDNQFANPYVSNAALTCRDADAGLTASPPTPVGANEVNSSVVWGSTDQNGYTVVTGVATPALFGGAFLPPGSTTTCTALQEAPGPGKVTVVKPANPLPISTNGSPTSSPVGINDAAESPCFITATMPTVTGALTKGTNPGQCTIALAPQAPFDATGSPISFGAEAFTGLNTYANIICTCSSSAAGNGGITASAKSTLSFTSPNCSLTAGTSSVFTCEN